MVLIYRPLTLVQHENNEKEMPPTASDVSYGTNDWDRWNALLDQVRFLLPLMYTWCFKVANPDPHLDTVFPNGWIHFWSEL